jgi:hypothetical protein
MMQKQLAKRAARRWRAKLERKGYKLTHLDGPFAAAACANAHVNLMMRGKSTVDDVIEFGTAFLEEALKDVDK